MAQFPRPRLFQGDANETGGADPLLPCYPGEENLCHSLCQNWMPLASRIPRCLRWSKCKSQMGMLAARYFSCTSASKAPALSTHICIEFSDDVRALPASVLCRMESNYTTSWWSAVGRPKLAALSRGLINHFVKEILPSNSWWLVLVMVYQC